MMAAPLEDECAHQQLRSLIQTLKSMPTETQGRVVEDLKAAGIRSLEIKRTSPQNQQRIINVENSILERAKRLQNDAKLSGGLLAITPRSQKYILHRLEYLARPIAGAKLHHGDHKFKEFLSFLQSGELEQTESVWTTENQPHLDACFG